MSITIEQAKQLTPGVTLYQKGCFNADGTPRRWRVNGRPQLWKRSPERVRVPIKHGLKFCAQLTQDELHHFTLEEPARRS